MSIFCFVLILLVSQSFYDFDCILAVFVQLICWSVTVLESFLFNSLSCIPGLVVLCFYFVVLIFFNLP